MGSNSTEVSYAFGQLGSAYCDTNTEVKPPAGKVIVAIYFIQDNTPTALVADNDSANGLEYVGTEEAAHDVASVDDRGNGKSGSGGLTLSGAKFRGGSTIFGRWTSVTPQADEDGGIICYFGE